MKTTYKQVNLEKSTSEVTTSKTTTYIPTEFATLHRYIKLKDSHGNWEDGWKIVSVSSQEFDATYINERSQDFKNTRKASDI